MTQPGPCWTQTQGKGTPSGEGGIRASPGKSSEGYILAGKGRKKDPSEKGTACATGTEPGVDSWQWDQAEAAPISQAKDNKYWQAILKDRVKGGRLKKDIKLQKYARAKSDKALHTTLQIEI